MDAPAGGVVGGLYAVFDGVGLLFFTFLIGSGRAQRPSLEGNRVVFGGLFFGAFFGVIVGFLTDKMGLSIVCSVLAGFVLALILLSYVGVLEAEEQEAIRKQKIADLKVRERQRIERAKQQGISLNLKEEIHRESLVKVGIDPDDPDAPASRCFIATAVFESPTAPEVVALRRWRDEVLAMFGLGRCAVRLYYRFSPSVAGIIAGRPFFKRPVKGLLRWLVKFMPN